MTDNDLTVEPTGAAAAASDAGTPKARQSAIFRAPAVVSRYGVLSAFVATIIAFSLLSPDAFPTVENLKSILTLAAPLFIVAAGLTVVLVMGDFDLSIGAMIGLGGAATVVMMAKHGMAVPAAILIGLGFGVAGGLINGFLVAYLGGSSFIITLGMGTIITGVEFALDGQETILEGIPTAYANIGQSELLFGLTPPVWIAAAIALILYALLSQTELGRRMYATGSNAEAARLSGINIRRTRLIGFVIVAVMAALAGILLTATAAAANPNLGNSYLLPAFAAAFLGSAVFRVGQFHIIGTLIGVLFLGEIQTGLTILGLDTWIINVVQGGILVAAILLSRLNRTARG